MNEVIAIPVLVFIGLVLMIVSCYLYYEDKIRKKEIIGKIDKYTLSDVKSEASESKAEIPVKRFFTKMAARLAPFSQPRTEEELGQRRRKLSMAGYRRQGNLIIFYGSKVFFAMLLPAALFIGHLLFGLFEERRIFGIMIVFSALVGFYGPDLWVYFAITRRQEKIQAGFPDALDLMVVCVEAGMGLDQAIKRIADEMRLNNKVISDEFGLMSLEMRAGRSRQDAMRNLGLRTGVEDVKSLVTLLIQTDKFGTSIAQALRVHSDSMRTKRRQRAEETATKLPVKLLFPLILFIFPALFVVIVGPAAIRIYRVLIEAHFGRG